MGACACACACACASACVSVSVSVSAMTVSVSDDQKFQDANFCNLQTYPHWCFRIDPPPKDQVNLEYQSVIAEFMRTMSKCSIDSLHRFQDRRMHQDFMAFREDVGRVVALDFG